jgi:hypothetical protein
MIWKSLVREIIYSTVDGFPVLSKKKQPEKPETYLITDNYKGSSDF